MSPEDAHLVASTCLALHARRAARRLARAYDEALKPAGLSSGQFSLMVRLAAGPGAALSAVASDLGMDRTSLTAALKPLEREGLVASAGDAVDGRVRRLALTEAGRARLAAALPLWRRAQASADAKVGSRAALLRSDLNALG